MRRTGHSDTEEEEQESARLSVSGRTSLAASYPVGRQTMLFSWRSRLPRCANFLPHYLQEKGRRPMCVLTWSLTLQSLVKVLGQCRH